MSIGSVPKRFRCIILSASVISPSMVYKSAVDCIEMLTKLYPKITYSSMVKNMKKWSGIHASHQKFLTSKGSPPVHVYQVWSTSVSTFVSYPVYRMTERSHVVDALWRINIFITAACAWSARVTTMTYALSVTVACIWWFITKKLRSSYRLLVALSAT